MHEVQPLHPIKSLNILYILFVLDKKKRKIFREKQNKFCEGDIKKFETAKINEDNFWNKSDRTVLVSISYSSVSFHSNEIDFDIE